MRAMTGTRGFEGIAAPDLIRGHRFSVNNRRKNRHHPIRPRQNKRREVFVQTKANSGIGRSNQNMDENVQYL